MLQKRQHRLQMGAVDMLTHVFALLYRNMNFSKRHLRRFLIAVSVVLGLLSLF